MSDDPMNLAIFIDSSLGEARDALKVAIGAGNWASDTAALALAKCEMSLARARLATLDAIKAVAAMRNAAKRKGCNRARDQRRGHRAIDTIYPIRNEKGQIVGYADQLTNNKE